MRISSALLIPFLAVLGGCGMPTITGEDIENGIERAARSAAGPWQGEAGGANPIVLDFVLTESGDQVQGTGTMKEAGAASAVAVTVSGTYRRPTLSLTFSGMTYEGHAVTGTFRGSYAGVIAVDSLRLAGGGFSRSLPAVFSEK